MPQNNAVVPDVKPEPVVAPAAETASTATTPETPTETVSTASSSLMDRLGVPAEVQQELESRKPKAEPEQPATADTVTEPAEAATPVVPDEDSAEDGEVPHQDGLIRKEVFDKRVSKLSKQKNKAVERAEKAEELAEQLRAQLEATQPVTVTPNSDDLLADVTNETQLEERKQLAKVARDYYRARQNGFTVNEGTPQERDVSAEEVATILGRVEDVLNEHAPRKAVQLQERRVYDEQARQLYPDLFKPTSEDYQKKQIILKRFPALVNDPGVNVFIGHFLKGAKATEDAKQRTTGDPAADQLLTARAITPPIAPHVPAAQRSNGSTPSRQKVDQAMNNLVQEGGSREALIAAVRAKRESGNKTAGARELVSV